MAQVSYGTITITDTTDIERIYLQYCRSTDNQLTNGEVAHQTVSWQEATPSWVNGEYIWQRSVIKQTGISTLTYGVPVCLTGAAGTTGAPGQSLTATKTEYTIAASNVTINLSNHTSYTWTTNTPDYDVSKPAYWGRITNTYTNPSKTEYLFYKDEALSKAVADAAIANSIAQHANEDAQGAMSQAASAVKEVKRIWFTKATSDPPEDPPETGVTTGSASTYNSWSTVKPAENPSYPYYFYCDQTCTNGGVYSHSEILLEADPYTVNALNIRTKNFFHGKDSTYDGWFASGRSTSEGLNESDATTYYYNARFGASHVTLGYNKTPVIDLDGTSGAINIYRLPTINSTTKLVTAAGKLGAKLNASALTFYNTSGTATSTFGDSIALASNGASITIGSTSTGKYNTYIDAQGLYLRTGTTPYATLNANGLVLSKGGIEAGDKNTNNYIYVYSHDDATNHTLAINSSGNKSDWRIIAGNKFGVDKAGNLYASSANISGKITATSGSFTGTIHALNGEFNGTVTASSGTIGRWQITSSALFTNSGSTSAGMGAASDYAFWAGNEAPASAPFRVNYNGAVTATNGSFTGTINATSFNAYDSSNKLRAKVDTSGLTIYASDGSTITGQFNGSTAQIGSSSGGHIYMSATGGIQLYNTSNTDNLVSITSSAVTIGKLSGANAYRTEISSSGLNVIQRNSGNNGENTVASFTGTHVKLGSTNGYNWDFTSTGLDFRYGANISSGYIGAIYMPNSDPDRGMTISTQGIFRIDASKNTTFGTGSVTVQNDLTVVQTIKAAHLIATSPSTGTSSTANCRLLSASSYGQYEVGFTASSSKRYKHDIKQIEDLSLNPNNLYDLEVKQFIYNDDYLNKNDQRRGKPVIGFIAEDVEKIYPIAADYRDDRIETWDERYIIPPMLALLQKQHKEIEQLKKEVEKLQNNMLIIKLEE